MLRRTLPLVALGLLTPSIARAGDDLPSLVKEVHGQVKNLMDAYANYQQCLARGADPALCESLAIYCAIPGTGLIDSRAGMFSKLDLFQVFKLDCGDGECYQCCFTGDGCHTSFVGFPVINCNANYGPETRDVGITLITDPNAQPGDPCISTPQTCEHLSPCLGDPNALVDLRDELEQGLDHPLTMAGAAEQRLRYFGKDLYAAWRAYLNAFHTGIPPERDSVYTSFTTVAELDFFLTGRGCEGWRQHVAAVSPYDWSGEHFALYDGEGIYSPPASQLNGIAQLGLMRLVDALPNLAGRHAAVESTVWPDVDRDAYLGTLAVDPDEAILQVASPIFLDLLKQNHKVSDYRLLAVPLAGEDASARFNGCLLGAPPKVFSEPGPQPGAITLTIDDPEAGGPYAADRPALVLWGDGTASRETIAVGQGAASFTHDYKLPGSYAVYAVVENTSGLRGVTSALVEVSQGAAEASAPHVFTEVRFVDAIAHVTVTSGNERKLSFEVSGRDVDTGEELLLGVGQERSVPFNVDAPLGTLVGHNPGARTIDRITLRPAWRDGFYGIGWGGHSLTLARLELRVPSTSSTDPVYVPVPLTTDNVRVYPVDGDAPVDVEYLTTTDDDRTLIWLHTSFVADRIEIDIPAGLLAESAPGPLADGAAPVFESHVEIRPGTFEPANTPSGETDGDSDGGSDGSDSTAGTGDTGDGATSDATAGTDSASGSGQDGGDGCGCAAGSGGALGLVLLPLLGFARRRRRTP